MTTPATASTGTRALMPMSGASAAVRITPGPTRPTPTTLAGARLSAGTAASVGASRSNLVARQGAGPARGVDRHVGESRFRYLDDGRVRRPPLRENFHLDGD